MIAVLGLLSAVVYGASDFVGGLASRRLSALETSLTAFGVGALVVGATAAATSPTWSQEVLLWGFLAGLAGSIGQWAFYGMLAIGPMSVLSPAVATIYALVPAVVGLLSGERFAPIGYVALVAVVVAAVLLAVPADRRAARLRPRALLLGLVAGLGFAGYIIAIDRSPVDSGVAPILVDYATSLVVYLVVLAVTLARRRRASPGTRTIDLLSHDRRGYALAALAGLLIGVANILLILALHLGDLALVGVLNSLYPMGTVVLALVVLRERISALQAAGILLALAASAALALV